MGFPHFIFSPTGCSVVDAAFSEPRNAQAVNRFFERTIDETVVKPTKVTAENVNGY
jgi:hypothetical protein